MSWLKKLVDAFNPAQTPETVLQAGHIAQNAVPLRTRLFTQPADPFSLEAITGKSVATAIQWEALPSEKHVGLWYVQQVSHNTIDGATTLDYGLARTPRYIPYEEAVNILALMETSEGIKQHPASAEPADYFRTHAEQEGFVQNTQGQLVKRSVEGGGGQFTQDSLKRAQENAQKAITAQGGIFTSIFSNENTGANLVNTLTIIENAATLENGLVRPLQSISAHLAMAMDAGERTLLRYENSITNAPLKMHLDRTATRTLYDDKVSCEKSYCKHGHAKYTADASERFYNSLSKEHIHNSCGRNVIFAIRIPDEVRSGTAHVTRDENKLHLAAGNLIGYSEDAVRVDINRALAFVSIAQDHILSPADKRQFTRLIAVAGIDALTRYAQVYFRELARDLTDSDDLSARIKTLNADIGKLKERYLPDVSPAVMQHIEQTIMSPAATAAEPVSQRICAAMAQWRESVISRLNQPGQTALPAVSGVAQGLLSSPG